MKGIKIWFSKDDQTELAYFMDFAKKQMIKPATLARGIVMRSIRESMARGENEDKYSEIGGISFKQFDLFPEFKDEPKNEKAIDKGISGANRKNPAG